MQTKKTVLLALSGGVDSAVSAHLLKTMGYDVHALVISFSPQHQNAVAAAKTAAKQLNIPLHIAHAESEFEEKVILPFCRDYSAGRTPSPCVFCNPLVKFNTLINKANELGIHYIATGHYARTVQSSGIYYVSKAKSTQRDQSYMLYRIPQNVLSRLLLPLGELEKSEIRSIASTLGLSSATLPDSQDICFTPSSDYASYILSKGFDSSPGHFIGPGGEDLGAHSGILHYTVGQRRGLGVSYSEPLYVSTILPSGNIQLSCNNQLFVSFIQLSQAFWASGTPPLNQNNLTVKIRSTMPAAECKLDQQPNTILSVIFSKLQRAPAPGQHAVIYHGEAVLGGGVIEKPSV